jgi:hypothetical protein
MEIHVLLKPRELGGVAMVARYDIFKKFGDGSVLWMEEVKDFDRAKVRMRELAQRSAGEYFIFDQHNQAVTALRSKGCRQVADSG